MIRQSYLLLIVIAAFFACQGTETEVASEPINLELEVTDSDSTTYHWALKVLTVFDR